jgi:predicted dinucleotide-binding enzyme
MNLGILGTGRVAQTLASRWTQAGHGVTFGSRDPSSTTGLGAPVASSLKAVTQNEVVVNATPGAASLQLMAEIGAAAFGDRLLIDVANANTPAFELVYPNSSLGERIQSALPATKVVKTMNTAAMTVMTAPPPSPPVASSCRVMTQAPRTP